MTRHSPSEAALGEIPVSGLHANFTLLTAFNDAVGKEVLLELVDGSVFTGIFGGASSEMEVGLYCAYEKTAENEKNLLPLKKDIVQKRQFAFSDIVCVTVPTNDEKMIRGFATDRDYHSKRRVFDDEEELEEWVGDGEDVDLESEETVKAIKNAKHNGGNGGTGGWGVNEMFAANESLGVTTTFEDNLSQYTTAHVEGTDEDRRRADEIARQIEKSGSSRLYSALENDDEERDLDIETKQSELGLTDPKNKKEWSNGSSTTSPSIAWSDGGAAPFMLSTAHSGPNGPNGPSVPMSLCSSAISAPVSVGVPTPLSTPRPPSLMNTIPPGFPSPPGFSGGFTTVTNGRGRKGHANAHSDHSHTTYLQLANRGVNNNGRGGSQMTPKNNRAEGLKGEPRRASNSGGMGGGVGTGGGPVRGGPLPSPKGGERQPQSAQSVYVKRDSYEAPAGGQHYDNWNTKGGMKTFENTKMRNDQKMMLENRNTSANSPRNAGGPPSGPSTPHNQKGGASGRVEGLKAWQNDFNPSYRETRPQQKGPTEKTDKTESQPAPPLLESVPPTKNAWQSGPPSGLTSSSRSDDSKSGGNGGNGGASPSNLNAPTPAELKMNEERETKEETGASTSNEEERTGDGGDRGEKKEDADVSKDSSSSKKFSFNPDAPAFTPKFGGSTGGMGVPQAGMTQTPIMIPTVPMATSIMGPQGIPMQAPMGAMGGMQQPTMMYTPYGQPHYTNMQPNMQYSAVVNGGAIMAGAAQNGQGQTGGTPSTPRGNNGGGGAQGGNMGGRPGGQRGPTQTPTGGTGGGGGGVPVTMSTNPMYMPQQYQPVAIPQQSYMQTQPNAYYAAYSQPQMMQGSYPMGMTMQQQGMMGQPQRGGYVPQQGHPGMMMQSYVPQQQYGTGPPPTGVPQGGGGGVNTQGGQTGATPSVSTTNGGATPSNGNAQGTHPPSQPPTPGAVSSQSGVAPPQGALVPGGPPGMAPPPVPSPGMYGMQYAGGPSMVYYQGGAPMGGMEMHGGGGGGGEGTEGMHNMHQYQYNAGQYYQNAPPHLRQTYQPMNHNMQQQSQHAPAQPSQSQN